MPESARHEWFGGRLKELRTTAGLTQQQLAEKAGLKSAGGIRDLEQGVNRRPTWETVLALAEALGVDCTAFTQPPAEREAAGPGRPAKPKDETAEEQPKRPRGRPKKKA